jgi:hypothetical protein
MTSILSTISGYFSKSLILGAFLPVVIFVIFSWLFLVPLLPSDWPLFQPLAGLDKEWKIVAVSFITIVLSGLIYNLNIPILRVYEGYPWKNSWVGRWRTRHYIARYDEAMMRIEAMRALLRVMDAALKDNNEALMQTVVEKWKSYKRPLLAPSFKDQPWLVIWETPEARPRHNALAAQEVWKDLKDSIIGELGRERIKVKREFQDIRAYTLPTRLGNVTRSFELYAYREYKMDAIELWSRLIAIIKQEYAASIDDAKTTFDFMLNCSALNGLLAALILLAGLTHPSIALAHTSTLLFWVGKILIFAFLAYVFYELSIERALAWGDMVRGAFDLYRWDLLKQLGFKQEVKTREAERNAWAEVSRQMIYGDAYSGKMLDYEDKPAPTPPFAVAKTPQMTFEVARGIKPLETGDGVKIFLSVKNTDATKLAEEVLLTDKLSDEFDYEWDTARIEGEPNVSIAVAGVNPYQFTIGNIPASGKVVLYYQALRRASSRRHSVDFHFDEMENKGAPVAP